MKRSSGSRAFTIVEMLVCIAIIAVVAAITYPVFAAAKKRSYEAVCAQNLHSLWLTVALYRESADGKAECGATADMGLPPPILWENHLAPKVNLHCRLKATAIGAFDADYMYEAGWPEHEQSNEYWIRATTQYLQRTILFSDFRHGDIEHLRLATYPHLGLGVDLSGTLRRKEKTGSISDPEHDQSWWNDPP